MLGLSFEKLILISLVAALIVGPQRLPLYAEKLAQLVRTIRDFTDTARTRATVELGPEFDLSEWKKLDPRRYDPRRIIQETLADPPTDAAQPTPVQPTSEIEGPSTTGQDKPTIISGIAKGGWQEALLARTGTTISTAPDLISTTSRHLDGSQKQALPVGNNATADS